MLQANSAKKFKFDFSYFRTSSLFQRRLSEELGYISKKIQKSCQNALFRCWLVISWILLHYIKQPCFEQRPEREIKDLFLILPYLYYSNLTITMILLLNKTTVSSVILFLFICIGFLFLYLSTSRNSFSKCLLCLHLNSKCLHLNLNMPSLQGIFMRFSISEMGFLFCIFFSFVLYFSAFLYFFMPSLPSFKYKHAFLVSMEMTLKAGNNTDLPCILGTCLCLLPEAWL